MLKILILGFSLWSPYLGVGMPVKVGILDDRLIPLPFLFAFILIRVSFNGRVVEDENGC